MRAILKTATDDEYFQNELSNIDKIADSRVANLLKARAEENRVYFLELQTNWSGTMGLPPHTMPAGIRNYHEVMQFYFAGRTNYEEASLATLLSGNYPQHLNWNKAGVSESDWRGYESSGLCLRVCWFKLFLQLDPQNVLEKADPAMRTVLTASQFLSQFPEDPVLYDLATIDDFDQIMNLVDAMPDFTDDYIESMAKLHLDQLENSGVLGRNFPKSPEGAEAYLKSRARQYETSVAAMYSSAYDKAPVLFETRMLVLEAWINDELDCIASGIDAVRKGGDGKDALMEHYLNFLDDALRRINHANIPQKDHPRANAIPKLTEENMYMVRELSRHVGVGFDVNFASDFRPGLSALQSGDFEKASGSLQPDDASANATLPIAILAEYAERSTNDAFKADLQLIKARLDGLRDLAKGARP
jgi:hypothetical protein